MLSLRHFIIFKAVSETGNFTKAAHELYVTQSAVSHTIRELEEYTGTILFDRLSRQVRLTASGLLLLEEVSPILAACESLEKRIGQLEMQAPVHIVSSITIASFWLPHILQQFNRQMPQVPVYVEVVSAGEAVHILRSGGAEIALVEGIRPQGPFFYAQFAEYALKMVASPAYPKAGRQMSVSEFCSEKLLLRETGSAIRDTLDSKLLLLGYTARPIWVSVNSTALVEAAKAGLGITVMPEVLVKEELSKKKLVSMDVEGLSLKNDLLAVWHREKHMTPALEKLLSLLDGFML